MAIEKTGGADDVHEVTLISAIDQVSWSRTMAAPGATVGLEIRVRHVGSGAEAKIRLTDHQGRSHGSFEEALHGNRFVAEVRVPADASDALYAKVKLPRHGLEATSPPLLLTPTIRIDNPQWDKQEARRGDILTLSADIDGAPDGTNVEISIWEHDEDGAHDLITEIPTVVDGQKVETEWAFEYHEDTDELPTEEEAERGYNPPEYFFRVTIAGLFADSGILRFKDWIEIVLLTDDGVPIGEEDYVLHLPDGTQRNGTLDADGRAEERDVPPGRATVEFPNL